VCGATVLWLMLWAGNNSGPWVFYRFPAGLRDGVHFVRTAFPLLVLVIAPWVGRATRRGGLPGPLKLWAFYGLVGLAASAMSPRPLDSLYWAFAYLASLAALAAYLRGGDPLERSIQLNYLTWLVTTGILGLLCLVARDVLREAAQTNMSAYYVSQAVGGIGGMPVILGTGMARFAAVPAVVAYVMLWRDRPAWRRVAWGGLFAGTCLLMYMMQSRGATAGLAFALVVVTCLLGTRARILGLAGLAAGVIALAYVPQETTEEVFLHLTRGQQVDQLATFGGRTSYWAEGCELILQSPVFGYGFQADRALGVGHVHNTYLYVMLTAGIVGFVPFVAGLAWAWLAAFRAFQRALPSRLGHEAVFAQAVGILAFFTARSIPEVCGGLFMVDLLVMIPAMAYLVLLASSTGNAGLFGSERALSAVPRGGRTA